MSFPIRINYYFFNLDVKLAFFHITLIEWCKLDLYYKQKKFLSCKLAQLIAFYSG